MDSKSMWHGARNFRSAGSVGSSHVRGGPGVAKQSFGSGRRNGDEGSTGSLRMRIARRAIVGSVLTLIAVVSGELVFQTLLAPNLAITTVRVTGDDIIDHRELSDIAGLDSRLLYFHVDPDAIAARLETVPEVRRVEVTRHFPDTLRISVEGRTALAVTSLRVNGEPVPAVIDEEGVVFRTGLRASERDMPVISGIQLEAFAPGDTLPDELTVLFEDLRRLRLDEPSLYAMISELRVVRRGGRYETVLYPVHVPVPIRMPGRAEAERYRAALQGIEALRSRGDLDAVQEMDLRGGDVVYTMRAEG